MMMDQISWPKLPVLPSLLDYSCNCKPIDARSPRGCQLDRIIIVDPSDNSSNLGSTSPCRQLPTGASGAAFDVSPPPKQPLHHEPDFEHVEDVMELSISMMGGQMHRVFSSAQATGYELRCTLAAVSCLPPEELMLVRGGQDFLDLIGDGERPFRPQPALYSDENRGRSDSADVNEEELSEGYPGRSQDLAYEAGCLKSTLELLRVLPHAAAELQTRRDLNRNALTAWELDHVHSFIASIGVRNLGIQI